MEDLKGLDFQMLVKVCEQKGIKVEKGDLRVTLLEKLTTKPKKGK